MTSHSDREPAPVYDEPRVEFDHVMIDIETMSLHPHNALILSVGMLEFEPGDTINGLIIGKRQLLLPNIEQQLLLGREVSGSTQKFWKDQKREASAHWAGEAERLSLARVCNLVKLFCSTASRVWANGTQFDLSNLVGLNAQLGEYGEDALWHYQAPRDMRTFVRETPATRLLPVGDALDIKGVAHEPLYDCEVQAHQVWAHWQDGALT